MAKSRGTDGSLLSSLPWTLAAGGFALAPHVVFLPVWITVAFAACAVWRYGIEKRRRSLPSGWLRACLALVCFLGVLGTYSTISGVGPGSALLAIMAALKLLETRRRRDQFVLLFIAIFLIMSSLLREQYIWSLPYLVVGILLTMTAWLRLSASAIEAPRQSFATSSRLVMYAAPIAIAMWIFFPRIATPFWAVPIDTSRGTSGLSESMSPGDISSLSLSDEVAFRVTFEEVIPAPRERYWRGLVLTLFNGRTWTSNDPFMGPRAHEQVAAIGNPVRYQITLEPTQQIWVFALDMPWSWTLSRTFMGPQQQLARGQPIDQRVAYEAVSYTDYRTEVDLRNYARDWYVSLPDGTNPRAVTLAREMRAAVTSDRAYIEAVLAKFHEEEYFYTLEPPALGSNPVDRFLFDTRQGFCEHYASAFAVLMRAANVPARIVLGYQGGEINPMGGHLIVRQSDAHAWNEVWLPSRGWFRVDPTAAVAPERIDSGIRGAMFDGTGAAWGLAAPSALLHRLTLTWDVINAKWNEWILGYGPDNQNRFMKWLGMDDPDWRKMMLTLVATVAVLTGIISLALMWRYRPPPKDRAAVLYQRFVNKTGVLPTTGETPIAFARRAGSRSALPVDTIEFVTTSYLDARYGLGDADAMRRLESAVAAL
jgi:transglutaminase-like putative cysteine protease